MDSQWSSGGLTQLGEATAASTKRQLGIAVEPDEIVVTPGGKPIIFFAMLALIEPGDEVLCPNPGFPIYESMIRFAGGRPVLMGCARTAISTLSGKKSSPRSHPGPEW
jgi:aspartate aminotransferase